MSFGGRVLCQNSDPGKSVPQGWDEDVRQNFPCGWLCSERSGKKEGRDGVIRRCLSSLCRNKNKTDNMQICTRFGSLRNTQLEENRLESGITA